MEKKTRKRNKDTKKERASKCNVKRMRLVFINKVLMTTLSVDAGVLLQIGLIMKREVNRDE